MEQFSIVTVVGVGNGNFRGKSQDKSSPCCSSPSQIQHRVELLSARPSK